ncbi:MAG: ABC transporter ATP-binding protein [Actinobacteria bacterium]|nr:ABC transporter ATP-binding protein [Actinomycetota bacterium]
MIEDVPAIRLEGVAKQFGQVEALRACDLSVPKGCFLSLLGPSGCGKTTMLRLIAGFESQDRGTIRVHGETVDGLPPNKRNVNTVFQGYALFPHRTVAQNIAFPLEIKKVGKAERRERVGEMLALVHLEGLEERKASQLSGGQAQRVALARALVGRPEVLLLDEPLAALDLKLRKAMQLELRRIQQELGTTFIFVTHDQSEALTMSDQIVLMNGGEIVQQGAPADLYDRPQTVFASQFIGEANLLEGRVAGRQGSDLLVRVGPLEIAGPDSEGFSVGDEAVLSVRPEKILAGHNGSLDGLPNRLTGVVREQIFLGHLIRFIVEVAPGTNLVVEQSAAHGEAWAVGATIELGWAQDAVTVLSGIR